MRILLVAVLLSIPLCAGAEEGALCRLADALPPPVATQLGTAGKIVRSADDAVPTLLPAVSGAAETRAALALEKPGLLVEALFRIARPRPAGPPAEQASILAVLRSVSTLQGLEYWSRTQKAMRTLFSESYRVDDAEARRRLPDPPAAAGALPARDTMLVFQHDVSFGANVYQYDYTVRPETTEMRVTNLTRLSRGILPVAAPRGLVTRYLAVQCEDEILFHVASGSNAPGFMKGSLQESFGNRAEAVFRWFQNGLKSAPK